MKNNRMILIVLLLLVVAWCVYLFIHSSLETTIIKSSPPNIVPEPEVQKIIEKTNETGEERKDPPLQGNGNPQEPSNVGSTEWMVWFQKLSQTDQMSYLRNKEKSLFPGVPIKSDWEAVKVSSGPGVTNNDYFPCKVLTNYKPLLQVRSGIGVVGLQFSIIRNKDSILTSIWAPNAKGAILVDWVNEKIIPADIKNSTPGIGLSPQYVPDGMNIFGGNGRLCIGIDKDGGGTFKWRNGYAAYPLAMDRNDDVAFGEVLKKDGMKPGTLDSIICVNLKPPEILGEVKMPFSATGLWCIYDRQARVLIIVEHEWNWMAMIDFSKPNAISAKPSSAGDDVEKNVPKQ